jgi:hypothetical protein
MSAGCGGISRVNYASALRAFWDGDRLPVNMPHAVREPLFKAPAEIA